MAAHGTIWPARHWMGLGLLLALLLGLLPGTARATHIRAGQIESKVDTTAAHNPRRIFFKLTIYQNIINNSAGLADQQDATLYFGDGTSQKVNRASGLIVVMRYAFRATPTPA